MGRCVAVGCLITFTFTGKIFSSGNSAYIYFYRKSKLSQPFRWLNYLNDSILESLLPGGLHHGNLSRSISNDLFISFMRALSLSHADFLYCSVIKYIIKYYRHGQPLPDSHSNMRVWVWIRMPMSVHKWMSDTNEWDAPGRKKLSEIESKGYLDRR